VLIDFGLRRNQTGSDFPFAPFFLQINAAGARPRPAPFSYLFIILSSLFFLLSPPYGIDCLLSQKFSACLPTVRRRRRMERSDRDLNEAIRILNRREKTAGHSAGMDAPPGPPIDNRRRKSGQGTGRFCPLSESFCGIVARREQAHALRHFLIYSLFFFLPRPTETMFVWSKNLRIGESPCESEVRRLVRRTCGAPSPLTSFAEISAQSARSSPRRLGEKLKSDCSNQH